jgi:CRISPR type III-B/RAMP module RAMP protein Cmr1
MRSLNVELEFLTPAFVGSADPAIPELRGASIRGHLRWWWRAGEGHRFSEDYAKMLGSESALFGGVGQGARRSPVVLRVEPVRELQFYDGASFCRYLGYGLQEKRNPRQALAPGTAFRLVAEWREGSLGKEQEEQFCRALARWIRYGGLGARSRKGFGALHLRRVGGEAQALFEKQWPPQPPQNGELPEKLPPFPQWQGAIHFAKLDSNKPTGLGVLRELEGCYREVRQKLSGHRWLLGEVEGKERRRASSVLIYVTREGEACHGGLLAFPCRKAPNSNERTDRQAWEQLKRILEK